MPSYSRLWIQVLTSLIAAPIALSNAGLLAQSAPVSRELVAAFARTISPADSQSTVDIVEGPVAGPLAADVHLPSSVQVLGTIAMGRSTYVMATSTLAPDSLIRAITGEYHNEHWDILSPATGVIVVAANGAPPAPQPGGFRQPASQTTAIYCRDSTQVRASAVHGVNATTLRVFVSRGGSNPCTRLPLRSGQPVAARPTPPSNAILPLLTNPPTAAPDIQCFNVNARSMSTNTELLTPMELPSLLDHYGKQLETQGWAATAIDAPMLRKVWSRRDSTGRTQTATLVVSVAPQAPMCREASLSISTSIR